MNYTVYIDGSCREFINYTTSGYGFAVEDSSGKVIYKECGNCLHKQKSPARAELEALYRCLLWIKKNKKDNDFFTIKSDCEVVVNSLLGISKRNKNRDLWEKIEPLCLDFYYAINIEHVKGHANNNMNILVDSLAKKGASTLIRITC